MIGSLRSPTDSSEDPWKPGEKVGRFQLVRPLASGGMAEVWLASQEGPEGFSRSVALKRIADWLTADPKFVEMFVDEARIVGQLSHPHIVQVIDFGEHQGSYYLAMELLDGVSLSRAGVRRGNLPPIGVALRLVSQAAEALEYAHSRTGPDGKPLGLVHRDISPQNLFATRDGSVKVLDFGIAKAANRVTRTRVGEVKGKLRYMSPEQFRGERLDGRADLFSLGAVLFGLLTGERLYDSDERSELIDLVTDVSTPQRLAHVLNPEVPESLGLIVAKAVERNRQDRYDSCGQFAEALHDWVADARLRVPPSDVARWLEAGLASPQESATGSGQRRRVSGAIEIARPESEAERKRLRHADTDAGSGLSEESGQQTRLERRRPGTSSEADVTRDGGASLRRSRGALLALAGILVAGGAAWAVTAVVGDERTPVGATPVADEAKRLPNLHAPAEVAAAAKEPERQAPAKSAPEDPARTAATSAATAPEARPDGPAPKEDAPSADADANGPGSLVTPVAGVDSTARPDAGLAARGSEPIRPAPAPVAMAPRGSGFLTLDSEPWAEVFLKKNALGVTPIVELKLPAGSHRLELQTQDGKRRTVAVEIRAGATTRQKIKF